MMMLRKLFFVLLLLSITSSAGAADRAADDDAQLDVATLDLIHEGVALRRSGKDEAALNVFLDAEKHAPNSVRVLLHVTAASQATGKWLLAHRYLEKASSHSDDPYYQRYRQSIRAMEDAVAEHIGQFRVQGSPPGAEVFLNGESLGTLPMASARPLEAGSYILEVKKAGFFTLHRPVTIAGGGGLSQEAVQLNPNDLSGPDDSRHSSGSAAGHLASSADAERSPLRRRWVTWTLAGTSVALLATSGVALAIRQSEVSHWNDNGRCLNAARPSDTREEICGDVRSNARTAEAVSIVSGLLGVGFGAGAVAHWLATSEHPSASSQSGGLHTCSAGLGSIVCSGTF
jgi:PEGA domain